MQGAATGAATTSPGPGTSNLSWSGPNENVAMTTPTAVDADAIGNLYASQATDVAVDVLGSSR